MLTVNCITEVRENEYTGIAGVMFIHNCKNLCSFLTCIFHIFFPQVKRLVVDFFLRFTVLRMERSSWLICSTVYLNVRRLGTLLPVPLRQI
jgi:hypothetical protein